MSFHCWSIIATKTKCEIITAELSQSNDRLRKGKTFKKNHFSRNSESISISISIWEVFIIDIDIDVSEVLTASVMRRGWPNRALDTSNDRNLMLFNFCLFKSCISCVDKLKKRKKIDKRNKLTTGNKPASPTSHRATDKCLFYDIQICEFRQQLNLKKRTENAKRKWTGCMLP